MDEGGANDQLERTPMSVSRIQPQPSVESPPPQEWSEQRLIEAVLSGERAAAGEFYDQLRAPIDNTLRRVFHQRGPDFEDHVQVTFERILRGLAEGRFEARSSLKTWACAIASHVALDALRKRQRERFRSGELPQEEALGSGIHTGKRLESLSELRRVHAILLDMKPELAEALILHDVLGYPVSEIGALWGASETATQSRLHRARIELKRRSARPISGRKL